MPVIHEQMIKAGDEVDITRDKKYLIIGDEKVWNKIQGYHENCVVIIRVEVVCGPAKPDSQTLGKVLTPIYGCTGG